MLAWSARLDYLILEWIKTQFETKSMPNTWAGWLAFIVLASVIAVASCQSWWAPNAAGLTDLIR